MLVFFRTFALFVVFHRDCCIMALDRWDNTKELYNKEADCVEADAGGTPAGDKVPFPWVKDKVSAAASSTPGATVPSRMCAPGAQTNLADSSDPLHLLAKLTMMLSHKNCHSTLVPQDLRTLVSTEIRQTAIKLEDGFLQRLQDLDIVSTAYVEELTNLKVCLGAGFPVLLQILHWRLRNLSFMVQGG